jgi:2'-5' RNA ligase
VAAVLLLPVQDASALPEGSPEYKPHVTVIYFGELTEAEIVRVKVALQPILITSPIYEIADSYSVFGPADELNRSLVIRLTEPGAANIRDYRNRALKALRDAGIQVPPSKYPEFLPHVTVDDGPADDMWRRSTTEKPGVHNIRLDAPTISVEGAYTDLTAALRAVVPANPIANETEQRIETVRASLMRYRVRTFDYNPEQPRDDNGRFGSGGGGKEEPSSSSGKPTVEEVRSWPKVSGPLGSQGGEWHKAPDGKTYLMKPTTTENRAANEIAAGAVYRAAGIPFPETQMIKDASGKPFILSEKIPDLEQRSGAWWNAHPEAQAEAAKGYGVDALLSHWDVLGLDKDNTLTTKDGTPVRIESGGAMAYRAMGGPKDSFAPGKPWGEPKSMRTGDQGRVLYGKMTDAQAADSLERAQNIDLNKVAQDWKQAGLSEKDTAPWLKTLEARQAAIPAIVGKLRGSSSLAIRLRVMTFETCHMPAGTPDGGQFVPCDTEGSVDSEGKPAGPGSASDIAQAAQKAALEEGATKADAKAAGDAAKAQAISEGVTAPASPYGGGGGNESGAGAHPGAGKLEDLSIKGLKGTPQYSTITHALYHLKHSDAGKPESAQHVGNKTIYEYHGKKYDYMVVSPTGDPKQPNAYEFIPKGGESALLGGRTVDDAIANKDAVAAQQSPEPLLPPVGTPTTADAAAALDDAAAKATSPADVAQQTQSIAPEAVSDAAELYAGDPNYGASTYESGLKEQEIGDFFAKSGLDEEDYQGIQDALGQGLPLTLIDDLHDAVQAGTFTPEQAAGVITGAYKPTQDDFQKIAETQTATGFTYIAGQAFGVINTPGYFDEMDNALEELHQDGIYGAEASMAALDQLMEDKGLSFSGTSDAAQAVSAATDISSQTFEPGGQGATFYNLTGGAKYPMQQDAIDAMVKMGYSPAFAKDLANVGTQVGYEKMFEAIEANNLQNFNVTDLGNLSLYATATEINTFITAADMKGGVSGDPASKLSGLQDVQAQNAPAGASGGLSAGVYDGLSQNDKYAALSAAGLPFIAADTLSWSGLPAETVMGIVDAQGAIDKLTTDQIDSLAGLHTAVIGNIVEGAFGIDHAEFHNAVDAQLAPGTYTQEQANFYALQDYQMGNNTGSLPEQFTGVYQQAWSDFKDAHGFNIGSPELKQFWSEQGFSGKDGENLMKMSEMIGMSKVLQIVDDQSLAHLAPGDIVSLANAGTPVLTTLEDALGVSNGTLSYGNPIAAVGAQYAGDKAALGMKPLDDAAKAKEFGSKLEGIKNPYEQMKAIQSQFPALDHDIAAMIADHYSQGNITAQAVADLLTGAKAVSDVPGLPTVLGSMIGTQIDDLATFLGAPIGSYLVQANLNSAGDGSKTKLDMLQSVIPKDASAAPHAAVINEINQAFVKDGSVGISDVIAEHYPFVAGTSFADLAGYGIATSSVSLDTTTAVSFLSGEKSAADSPGIPAVLESMSGSQLEALAVGMGAEPGAFLSQYDGISGTKTEVFDNVTAKESSAPADIETNAEKYSNLPFDAKYDFATQNGVLPENYNFLSDTANAIGGEKAFQIFEDQSLSHLSADDIEKMASAVGPSDLMSMAGNVLGWDKDVMVGLGKQANQVIGPLQTGYGGNQVEQMQYVLTQLQAMGAGDVPGTVGAIPGTTPDALAAKWSSINDPQDKYNALVNMGYADQQALNIVNAIDHPSYGLAIDKGFAMLNDPSHAATLLSQNDMAAFANMPKGIIDSMVPGFSQALEHFADVSGYNPTESGTKEAVLINMQEDQGGFKDMYAQPTPVGGAYPGAGPMDKGTFANSPSYVQENMLVAQAGVSPELASALAQYISVGVDPGNVLDALYTGKLDELSGNDIAIMSKMGINDVDEFISGVTGGQVAYGKFSDAVSNQINSGNNTSTLAAKEAALKAVIDEQNSKLGAPSNAYVPPQKGLGDENMQQHAITFASLKDSAQEDFLQNHGISKNMATTISYLNEVSKIDPNTLMKALDDKSIAHFTEQDNLNMLNTLHNFGVDELYHEVAGAPSDAFSSMLETMAQQNGTSVGFATNEMKLSVLQQLNDYYQPKTPPFGVQPTNYAVAASNLQQFAVKDTSGKIAYLESIGASHEAAGALVAAHAVGVEPVTVAEMAANGTMTGATPNDITELAAFNPSSLDTMLTGYGMKFSDLMTQAPPTPAGYPNSAVEWTKTWALSQMQQQSVASGTPQLADIQAKIAEIQAADKTISYKDAKDQATAALAAPGTPPVELNSAGGKVYGDPSVKVTAQDLQGASKVFNTSPVVNGVKPSIPTNAQIDTMIAKASVEYHSGDGISSYQHGNQVISLKQNSDGTFGARFYPNGVLDPATGKIEVPQPKIAVNAPGMSQASMAVLEGTGLKNYSDFKAAKAEYDAKQQLEADKKGVAKYPLPDINGKGAGEMPTAAKHLGYTAKGAGTTPGYVANPGSNGQSGYYVYGKTDKTAVNRFEKLRDTIAYADAVQHGYGMPQGVKLPYNLSADKVTGYSRYQFKDGVFTLYKTTDGRFGIDFNKGAKLEGAFEKIQAKPFSAAAGKVPVPDGGIFYGHEPLGQAKDFGNSKQAAIDWGDNQYGHNGGPKNYTATEFAALKAYGDGSYSGINGALRGTYGAGTSYLDRARQINDALRRTPTKEPITVYRGMHLGGGGHANQIISAPVGALFRDKGFMSTSVATDTAKSFAGYGGLVFKIDVPEGVPSAFKPGNQYPTESELLLPSNTTLEKTGDAYQQDGYTIVPVRVVSVGAEPIDVATAIQAGGGVTPTIVGSLLASADRIRSSLVAA